MGCCFSRKSNSEKEKTRANTTNENTEFELLTKRLANLYDETPPERPSTDSNAPRFSLFVDLECRLQNLQKPLKVIEEDAEDVQSLSNAETDSTEQIEELVGRLRDLGSGSDQNRPDINSIPIPDEGIALKKKLSEQKHLENLDLRLIRLMQPLSAV